MAQEAEAQGGASAFDEDDRIAYIHGAVRMWSDVPFSYNGLDCCRFVAYCVEGITGTDPMADMHYDDAPGARAIIKQHGSLKAAITACLGREPERKGKPKTGDITLSQMHDGEQIAGIAVKHRLVVRTERGIIDWPIEWAQAYWVV